MDYASWCIKPILSGRTSNNEALRKFLCDMRDNISSHSLIVGMFDRDAKIEFLIDDKKIDVRTKPYIKICNNIYAFSIPVPHNRKEDDQISIEHYFTDHEIKTEYDGKRLFIGNEFYETGVYKGDEEIFYKAGRNVFDSIKIIEQESKCCVTKVDGTGNYSISKAKFVECIENNEPGFCDISFKAFRTIFEIINDILEDWNKSGEKNDQL